MVTSIDVDDGRPHGGLPVDRNDVTFDLWVDGALVVDGVAGD